MPPKRSRTRKRQTKINFSPAQKPSPQALKAFTPSDSSDDGPSPNRPSKRRKIDKQLKQGREPVQLNGRGMFASSDIEDALSSGSGGSSQEESDNKDTVIRVKDKKGKLKKKEKERKARKQRTPEEESEDEIQVVRARKRGKASRQSTLDDDNEDEIQAVSARKSLRTKAPRGPSPVVKVVTPKKATQTKKRPREATPPEDLPDESLDEEQDGGDDEVDENGELKEELAFLQSSPLQERGRLRSTGSKPKSEREKALEALKKRRGGTNEPSSSSATTPRRKKPVVIESDVDSVSELEVIREEEPDEIIEGEEDEEIEDDDEGLNAHDVFRGTNEDEDFIDDNEEGIIGAPTDDLPRIPLAYTGLSTAKPRDLFKFAIEWMVQKKINPAFPSDDEIYTLAFRKLDDEVKGLASSKFHSSAWTPDFTRAIKARPDFLVNEIGLGQRAVMEAHCEACNRKNHTATWEVSLTGQPYYKDSLEPLASDSSSEDDNERDSDSDSDSASSALSSRASETDLNGEKPTYDALGERIPPESKTFTLGSTCKANAQVAHTLYHWRYHLNSWVVDYLNRQKHCTPEKLVKRDKWSVRKRGKYANKIVDEMETSGEIKKLHRLYKDQVNFALEVANDYKKGWGRRG